MISNSMYLVYGYIAGLLTAGVGSMIYYGYKCLKEDNGEIENE